MYGSIQEPVNQICLCGCGGPQKCACAEGCGCGGCTPCVSFTKLNTETGVQHSNKQLGRRSGQEISGWRGNRDEGFVGNTFGKEYTVLVQYGATRTVFLFGHTYEVVQLWSWSKCGYQLSSAEWIEVSIWKRRFWTESWVYSNTHYFDSHPDVTGIGDDVVYASLNFVSMLRTIEQPCITPSSISVVSLTYNDKNDETPSSLSWSTITFEVDDIGLRVLHSVRCDTWRKKRSISVTNSSDDHQRSICLSWFALC